MDKIYYYLSILAGLITSITTICIFCKKVIKKCFEPLTYKIDKIDENQCRNFLVDFLADVENRTSQR